MKKLSLGLILLSAALSVQASGKDDPVIGKLMIGQFEKRFTNGSDPLILEAQGWIGQDLNKLWIKADIEKVNGVTEEAELQFLYSRAIAPYWDLQVGLRHDSIPTPNRNWLAIGIQGVAPYFFEVDAALFVSDNGQAALRLDAEYEMMITQKWVLSPEVTFNFHAKNEPSRDIGSGLSDSQVGLRLRYEIKREFAPYIGVNWTNKYGNTADYARTAGEDVSDTQLVVGFRAWF